MDEVGTAVIAISLVLIAVFVPTAFIPGISGQFYLQFAITIAVSTAISAFNSLTLSPALAALLFKPHHDARRAAALLPGALRPRAGRRLQPRLRRAWPTAMRGSSACWSAHGSRSLRHARRLRGAASTRTVHMVQTVPRGFIPTHGPGLCDRRRPAAGRRLAGAHRRGGPAGLGDHPARRRASAMPSPSPASPARPSPTPAMPA